MINQGLHFLRRLLHHRLRLSPLFKIILKPKEAQGVSCGKTLVSVSNLNFCVNFYDVAVFQYEA